MNRELQKKLLAVAPGTGKGTASTQREYGNTHFFPPLCSYIPRSEEVLCVVSGRGPCGRPRGPKLGERGSGSLICTTVTPRSWGKY